MNIHVDGSSVITVLTFLAPAVAVGGVIWKVRQYVNCMRLALLCLVTAVGGIVSYSGARVHMNNKFDNECAAYVLAAYNTEDPALASKYMDIAVKYLDDNGMTKGSTGSIYNSPDTNLDDWYHSIKQVTDEINYVQTCKLSLPSERNFQFVTVDSKPMLLNDPDLSKPFWKEHLKKTNVIKISTTGDKDNKKETPEFQAPAGVSVFPFNTAFFGWLMSSISMFFPALGLALGKIIYEACKSASA